jgi:hypothetical protein
MNTRITALQTGKEWLDYVAATFMLENGSFNNTVKEVFALLESKDAITQERELWRNHTDELIDKIIQCDSPEAKQKLYSETDPRSLAFIQDRIQCGTELLIVLANRGLQIDLGEETSLTDYFRLILLQKQAE